jgi:hypothetical protein
MQVKLTSNIAIIDKNLSKMNLRNKEIHRFFTKGRIKITKTDIFMFLSRNYCTNNDMYIEKGIAMLKDIFEINFI